MPYGNYFERAIRDNLAAGSPGDPSALQLVILVALIVGAIYLWLRVTK